MKEINTVGDTYLKFQGKLCEVTGYAEGKVVFMKEVGTFPCGTCGRIKEYVEVESSPNFQEGAEPVKTIIQEALNK